MKVRVSGRRSGAAVVGLVALFLLPAAGSGQASLAVEGTYGRADGPVQNEVLGLGVRFGLPLGFSFAAEVSRWEAPGGTDCAESFPDSVKCDVGGWLGLGGVRVGLPLAWPLQPYLGAMAGRSLGTWTPGYDIDPSAWGGEVGLRLMLAGLEATAAYRYLSVSDGGYEALFGETPGYQTVLLRLGYAF